MKMIIFDGDDTLWKTQEKYDMAKREFAEFISDLGRVDEILQLLDDIDSERVGLRGFTIDRFRESMLITYAYLAGKAGDHYRTAHEVIINYIIDKMDFDNIELYDDAVEVLDELSEKYDIILMTKGDPSLQSKKLDSIDDEISSKIKRKFIVDKKTEEEYRDLLDMFNLNPYDVWVVGNSPKSDINPAVRIGMRGILIPRGLWNYEDDEIEEGVYIANSLTEAKDIILSN